MLHLTKHQNHILFLVYQFYNGERSADCHVGGVRESPNMNASIGQVLTEFTSYLRNGEERKQGRRYQTLSK